MAVGQKCSNYSVFQLLHGGITCKFNHMKTSKARFRWLGARLPREGSRRIVVTTGARQTGKTTLARTTYPDLRYFSLDDLEVRTALREVSGRQWHRDVGEAVLDEAQKEPSVFEKVKLAYDDARIDFSVLLGSSRFLLMDRARESLAGRSFIYDLWPLMASELRTDEDEEAQPPLLDQILLTKRLRDVLDGEPEILLGDEDLQRREALEHLARWGGMPELLRLSDAERREWLKSYQQTFLERDLADLVRLSDLEPFRKLQRLAMLRSGGLLSFADLARDASLSTATARRYLEYLRISYQIFLLQPFHRNLTSAVVKTPKLYWMDLGLLRQETLRFGPLDGPLFETLVVGEIRKWIDTRGRDVEMTFYRTRSGLEVDVLLRTEHGIFGVEIKSRDTVQNKDWKGLRAIAEVLGEEWLGGLVVYQGRRLYPLDADLRIHAVPVHRLL